MDLLLIARKIWRHKLLTLPLIVLTFLGAAYVVAVKQPVYQAKSSYVLLNPPAPPTAEDIARDPALARIKTDNPYTRFGDQSVVIQVLASTMSGDAARHALVRQGADIRYTVAPSSEFGYASPIVQITAIGANAASAIQTARLVGNATTIELDRMQSSQGVDKRYRIKPLQVAAPDQAELQASGQLRMLVGVLLLGVVLMFIVISIADALESLVRERRQKLATGWVEPLDTPWAPDGEPWQVPGDPVADAVPTNGHHPVPHPREHEESER
jgi:hypothetical protein